MASPRPDPDVSFTRFLVKKGSNTRAELVRVDATTVVGDGEHRVPAGRDDFVAACAVEEVDTPALLTTTSPAPADRLDRVANQVVDRPRQLRLGAADDQRRGG